MGPLWKYSLKRKSWEWFSHLQWEKDAPFLKEEVGADVYHKVLRYHVLPWLKANYREGNYVWTQDGASCHTPKKVQKVCKSNFTYFWWADFCLTDSQDLNPLDYAMWGVLDQTTNKTSHSNISSFKTAIEEKWAKMPKNFVVKKYEVVLRL